MKKIGALLVALLTSLTPLLAQDQLFKKDNTKLLVKIVEINSETVKYRLHSNPSGPLYTENKSDVALIIYESGQHETFATTRPATAPAPVAETETVSSIVRDYTMSTADSLQYFKYSQSLGINFLTFFNNEVGVIYQVDFFKSNFNIVIPFAIGVQKPNITQSVYFGNNTYNGGITLDKKNFEVGFGINYYPSLKTNINYFIGPAFRYMQYHCLSTFRYSVPAQPYYNNNVIITQSTNINRYCLSITNGVVIRTRSRLNASVFGSIGFKNDKAEKEIVNPQTQQKVNLINSPLSFYFWCGFTVGFCF